MLKFKTRDGETIQADTPSGVVSKLHEISLAQSLDDKMFMEETAERAVLQTGCRVRHDNPDHFINDLLKAGLLEHVS